MENLSEKMIEQMQLIYSKLQDDESRFIYRSRVLYSITQDETYMLKAYGDFLRGIENITDKEFIIYGAGDNCRIALWMAGLKGINISYICDRDIKKQEKGYENIPVISPQKLIQDHKNSCIIVSTTKYQKEAVSYLKEYFSDDCIILLVNDEDGLRFDEQYFDKEIIKLEDGEVFIDAGCYCFETSQSLLEKCKAEKIYAFEPDEANLNEINKVISKNKYENIEVYNKGLWNKSDILKFNANGTIQSCISADGQFEVEVVALDEVVSGKVTFIKMDIEGSELNALIGAQNIIRDQKPKLAICVYHKLHDIIDIPAYILSLVPEYKFYLRHYSYSPAETVLYAIP
ncbi:MAG: FkbM family methyltransferase [Clostridiales bacterium]|nr:FkbM family methyltransferase [Clostridiales bacterium]